MAEKRKKLSKYVRERLSAKIRKVRQDHPELEHKAVVGQAIGILQDREKKIKGFAKDVGRYESKNRKKKK